jgi:hypothetical protein
MRLNRSLIAALAALALSAGTVLGNEVATPQVEEDTESHCLDWSEGVPVVEEGDEQPSHGAYVCGAAKADWQAFTVEVLQSFGFDEPFRNHGAFMRWVAHRGYLNVDTTDEDEPTDEELAPEDEEVTEPEDEVVEPEDDEDGHCLDWSNGLPEVADGEEPNHGAYVCGAAKAAWREVLEKLGLDEDEFRNKGAWMRWVAHRMYETYDPDAEGDEDVTAESEKEKGKKDKAKGKGKAKGRGRHGR